jgi:hypothetical protein|tara:strand:+ start:2630 stop:4474 length:1845 start_codon:yes stop_codon:yes gene_type:complete
MAIRRNINYINKDFSEYRDQLINYSQTYFPTTYTDFAETSPGMMFIEQAAYVGDVLSFYLDNQIQENFIQYARQSNNLFELAYMFGYKPTVTSLANTDVDFYQIVPSKVSASQYVPDYDYALYVNANTQISTRTGNPTTFTIENPIDFSVSSSDNPTTVSIAQITSGNPSQYLLKKTAKAFSGVINSTSVTFGAPEQFPTTNIVADNIAGILDVVDSDGNVYYEVDYLGQDLVYDSIKNTNVNDPNNFVSGSDTPYVLKTKQVQNRFTTRFLNDSTLQLQFGAGSPNDTTEEIIPNPFNVGIGLPFQQSKLTAAYSPTNFVFTNTYGVAPSNTTLTIRYYTGGGVQSNILANTLTNPNTSTIQFLNGGLNTTTAQTVFNSIATNNPIAASGGSDGDTIQEIRNNILSNFGSQQRNVTADDYLVRTLSLPSQFGTITKAFTQKPPAGGIEATLDIYILSQDANGNLATANDTLKENLKSYLNQNRMIGDSLSIKNAFVINFGIDFEIITLPNYNNNKVLNDCIVALQDYFLIDKWQINQPIIINPLFVLLDEIDGVQTVKKIEFKNLVGVNKGYSQYAYDMVGATQNGTIFPSLDPSIFEIKFPNTDIKGRIVSI